MNATTYKHLIDLLQTMLDEEEHKPDDIVLWDLWCEDDYTRLAEDNVKVPWADVAKRVARKSDWVTEDLSQYLIETADDIEEMN